MLTDIEIAQKCEKKPIFEIAKIAGVDDKYLEPYGKYKAKVDYALLKEGRKKGKLILVTAITPTPAGEGKTTTSIGLADGLRKIGKNTIAALREPSLGPVFGIKGGAAGGGYAQVVPMEDINLHFTGDFHAITTANNLLCALLDNSIQQGNPLGIDNRKIVIKRCLDMNDRQLRFVVDGLGGKANGTPREDGFDITVATEMMAIFCLATSINDLKERIGRMVVAYTYDDKPVTAKDLHAVGAMTALLKDAIKPNLVQTLEGTPCFVHGGPFANIAHGCNSVTATNMAMSLADYTVTEAGFGADLGAEKFLDIKCRLASVYHLPCVVAINRFPTDTDAEIELVEKKCKELGVNVKLSTVWADGGNGGIELAKEVVRLCDEPNNFSFSYELDASIEEKLEQIVKKIYHGSGVVLTPTAKKQAAKLEELGFGKLPICVAKTQYSFSDDQNKLGAPENFEVTVRNIKVSAGAGFIVALTGEIMTMPGLPKVPAANNIDVDEDGNISGLF